MRSIVVIIALAAAFVIGGCDQIQPKETAADAALKVAQTEAAKRPNSRYQVAGKREYGNGTEIYVLDTMSGQVCYYFVASGRGDATSQKTDMRSCAGEALDPSI